MDPLARAQSGDQAAFDALEREMLPMLRTIASRYYAPGLDHDDVLQEARIGLFKAVRDYRPDRPASFRTFAALVIERQLATAVKTAKRGKHSTLNDASDLAGLLAEPSGGGDPVELIHMREHVREVLRFMRGHLSPLEGRALWLIEVEGLSYDDAAALLDVSFKALDNAAQRARRKLAEHFERGEPGKCDICLVEVRAGSRCGPCAEEIEFARELLAA